eukprot:5862991-Amphidinium_carterae.1
MQVLKESGSRGSSLANARPMHACDATREHNDVEIELVSQVEAVLNDNEGILIEITDFLTRNDVSMPVKFHADLTLVYRELLSSLKMMPNATIAEAMEAVSNSVHKYMKAEWCSLARISLEHVAVLARVPELVKDPCCNLHQSKALHHLKDCVSMVLVSRVWLT